MTTVAQYIGQSSNRKVRSKVGVIDKKSVYFPLDFKAANDDDDRLFFEGFANTINIDRGGDIIRASAWRSTIKDYLKFNPQVFYMHDWYFSIGQVTEAKVTKEGLWVRGYVQPPTDDKGNELFGGMADFIRFVRGQVQRGQLRTLSVGIRILESKMIKVKHPETGDRVEVREITDVELFENSLVTLPSNRESTIEAKSLIAEMYGEEVACSLVSLDEDLYEFNPGEDDDDDSDDEQGLTLELVSMDRQLLGEEPEYELVSLKERDDE